MSISRFHPKFGLITVGIVLTSQLSRANPPQFFNSPAMNAKGFKVIENDQPCSVIVIPDNPSAVVKYASVELQMHLKKATEAQVDIVPEASMSLADYRNRIYLGPCQAAANAGVKTDDLPPNSFRRKLVGNSLFLCGKDDGVKPPLSDLGSMGTLFAVYDWLETQLGVKWLWPGESGTVVPRTKDVLAGPETEKKVIPQLIHSRMRLNSWAGGMNPDVREKYIADTSVWLRRQRFARGASFEYGHAFEDYWKRFGESNPEYFALRPDGVRAPFDVARSDLVQMCVSNPALHRQIIADWLVQRREKPTIPWINGAENDKAANDPSCTCEVCRSWDSKIAGEWEGSLWLSNEQTAGATKNTNKSLSDRYAKFWLALQAEGRKHDPNATVLGYAYADYTLPPVETKLNQNIIVGIVPPYYFPLDEKERQAAHTIWDGWKKTGARLYLRPNYTLVGYAMPYVYAHQLGEEFKYEAANGMVATDFDSLLGMWGVQGVNTYVLARLSIDPTQNVDAILNEYYAGFGPAAKQVKNYFAFWEQITLHIDAAFKQRTQGGWGVISKGGDEIYTPENFKKGAALLSEAKTAAQNDVEARQRIEFLNIWLQHAQMSSQTLAAFHAQAKAPTDNTLNEAFHQAKTTLDTFRKQHEDIIGNVGLLRQVEVWSGWRPAGELKE